MELWHIFFWVNGVEESHRCLKWSVSSMKEVVDKDKTNGLKWYWTRHPVEGGDRIFVVTIVCMVVTWFRNGKTQMARWVYCYEFAGEWTADPREAEAWCCPRGWLRYWEQKAFLSKRGRKVTRVPQLRLVPLWLAKSCWHPSWGHSHWLAVCLLLNHTCSGNKLVLG